MEKQKTSARYSPEVRSRAVRMVLEHQGDHASQWAAIASIAAKIGCTGETLRSWVRQAERDQGLRPGAVASQWCRASLVLHAAPSIAAWLNCATLRPAMCRRGACAVRVAGARS